MTTPTLRSLTLALALAAGAFALPARAQLPEDSWWRQGDTTLGVHVAGTGFCAVGAAADAAWVVHGRVVDGRLVEDWREPLRRSAGTTSVYVSEDETDFFLQPTALVQRDRSEENPRGEFALFEPLPAAPSDRLWLDLAWHCADGPVDKTAAIDGE